MRRRPRRTPGAIVSVASALAVAAAAVVPAAPAVEADRSIPALLEACAARLDDERDIGVARVLAVCPDVERAFADAAVRPWLPADWRAHGEDLSAGSLRELALLLRESHVPPVGTRPDAALLAQVIGENARHAGADEGLWRRVLRWLRAAAGTASAPQQQPFVDWLPAGGRAATFWTVTGYVAFALVLAFAVWIVRIELRALGVGQRRAAAARAVSAAVAAAPRAEAPDQAAAPLAERPGLLLRRIAATLASRPELLRSEAWTVAELLSARPFVDAERAAQLALLARVAEAVRYSAELPDAATLREATVAGESLCHALEESAR